MKNLILSYRYLIGIVFLRYAIKSGIHDEISDIIYKYYKYIMLLSIISILIISHYDIQSGILLLSCFAIFSNIFEMKKYLRENFCIN